MQPLLHHQSTLRPNPPPLPLPPASRSLSHAILVALPPSRMRMVMLLSGNPLDPNPKPQNLKHETSNIKLKPLPGDYKGAFNVGQSITPNGIIISGVNSSRVFLSCEGSARGLAFLGDGTGSHAEVRDLTIRDCVGDYGRAHCMQHTRTLAHTCHRSGYFVCPFNCSSETCGA